MRRTFIVDDGLLMLAMLLGACVPTTADDEDADETAATTDGGGTTTAPGTSTSSGSTSTQTDGTTVDPDGSSGMEESSTSGDPTGGADMCSDVTMFVGDPLYEGDAVPNPEGEPIDGVPVPHRHLVFVDGQLVTHVGEEIWAADIEAAAPTFVRLAGERQEGVPSFATGPCATARFGDTRGLVALDGGSFAVADSAGNAILVVDDLLGAGCEVRSIAGNAEAGTLIEPPHTGDQDGTGTDAMFLGPRALVRGGDGALYFVDEGNNKIKRVTEAGAATTVVELPTDQPIWNAMTAVGDDLLLVGTISQRDTILRIATADGALETVLEGYGDLFPPLSSSEIANLQGVATDGVGLLVSGKGYVWYVTPDAMVTNVAGVGIVPDYPPLGYDPFATNPASEAVLRHPNGGTTTGGAALYMTYVDGGLYWNSVAQGGAYYVHRIACP